MTNKTAFTKNNFTLYVCGFDNMEYIYHLINMDLKINKEALLCGDFINCYINLILRV